MKIDNESLLIMIDELIKKQLQNEQRLYHLESALYRKSEIKKMNDNSFERLLKKAKNYKVY